MRSLILFFVKPRSLSLLMVLFVIGFGVMLYFEIRKEVFPPVDLNFVTVFTTWPGAGADEVEQVITNPIEQVLGEVGDIERFTSFSAMGESRIAIELVEGVDIMEAKLDVEDAIGRGVTFPQAVEDPLITLIETGLIPIFELQISREIPTVELREEVCRIEDRLVMLPEVARIERITMPDAEIHGLPSPELLAETAVAVNDLIQAIGEQNTAIVGGTIEVEPGGHRREAVSLWL
jgi:multidrug efflux pump subunit AcrB